MDGRQVEQVAVGVVCGAGLALGVAVALGAFEPDIEVQTQTREKQVRPEVTGVEEVPLVVDGEPFGSCDVKMEYGFDGVLRVTTLDCVTTEEEEGDG